jgi:spore coat protein U-like protein
MSASVVKAAARSGFAAAARVALVCVLCLPRPALAVLQTCTVAGTSVTFASAYDPSNVTGLDGTGTITVSCSGVGLFESWDLILDPGIYSAGSYTPRKLKDGSTHTLTYNLYTNLGHSSIWGDGVTSGTLKVSDGRTLQVGNSQYPYTVYAHVDALQDLPPGAYSDTITVTVNYN